MFPGLKLFRKYSDKQLSINGCQDLFDIMFEDTLATTHLEYYKLYLILLELISLA